MALAYTSSPVQVHRVRCAVCVGTGLETKFDPKLGARHVSLRSCFWCDGTGWCESEGPAAGPDTCPSCARTRVLVGGVGVCDECTRFVPSTPPGGSP